MRLDLRTRESALEGGAKGPALVPGNAEQSRLYRLAAGLDTPAMPMRGTPLTTAELATLKRWIDTGATWTAGLATASAGASAGAAAAEIDERPLTDEERSYWAFTLPVAPLPAVSHPRLTHPIDRFFEAERAARGLRPAPRADKARLARRAHLDLLGLPPSPEEVAHFVADESPDAWERLIDRLLASPHYGERYGRHWLDVARYADSADFEYEMHRPNAWRYREP